jgi:hypothetical protein
VSNREIVGLEDLTPKQYTSLQYLVTAMATAPPPAEDPEPVCAVWKGVLATATYKDGMLSIEIGDAPKPKKVVPLPDSTVQTMLQHRVVEALNQMSGDARQQVLTGMGFAGPSYVLFVNELPLTALTMLAGELGVEVPTAA